MCSVREVVCGIFWKFVFDWKKKSFLQDFLKKKQHKNMYVFWIFFLQKKKHHVTNNYHQVVVKIKTMIWIELLYTQYPIIRNGDQRWALQFLKDYQFLDADRFLILQVWVLAVS